MADSFMRFLRLLLLFTCLAACRDAGSVNGAVRVVVTYRSHTPACIRVSASDAQGHSADTDIPRSAFKDPEARELNVAVFRKPEWAQELTLEVSSYEASSGESCSGRVLERHLSPEPIAVSPGKVAEHEVNLQALDDDGDGHVLKTADVAGTDCMDSRRDVHPGVPEVCAGTVDFDCDGVTACADSDCLDTSCDDGNPCTENDACTAGSGSPPRCQGTPQIQCNSPPSQCHESVGTCSVATGACDYAFKGATASCDDSNVCTTSDACDGAGGCAGVDLAPCTPSTECHKSERLSCPTSADCTESVDDAKVNTPCTSASGSGVCRLPDGACSSFPYVPSNFDPDAIPTPTEDLHITCGTLADPVVCDTSGMPNCTTPAGCTFPPLTGVQVINQGGIETLLVSVRNYILDPGTVVKVRGSRPLIMAVYGDATISGMLLADADMEVPGAGGNRAACTPSHRGGDGLFSSGEGSGGGGGAFGSAGGAGGRNASNQVSSGGAALSSTLVPLVGGCQGGRGGGNGPAGGAGGGGGGALQISVAGTLRVASTISVSGGGGRGGSGSQDANNEGGGGGGGSGGGLLLEAFRLELTDGARLTANGGSGAEGGDSLNRTGSHGGDGRQESKDSATCPDVGGNGGPGGSGAAEGMPAAGGGGGPDNAGGGGGGGGVGVIRLQAFGSCAIDASCDTSDNTGCDLSPSVTPACPP